MFYKAIGLLVWKAVRFYVSSKLPSRKLLVGGARPNPTPSNRRDRAPL